MSMARYAQYDEKEKRSVKGPFAEPRTNSAIYPAQNATNDDNRAENDETIECVQAPSEQIRATMKTSRSHASRS